AGALLIAMSATAVAQQAANTVRLRGTVEKLDGNVVSIKTNEGASLLSLTDNALIVAVVKASMADIKEGTF
ncbi:hypothetical protein, partial [Escherichia coli]|uniref:hypothetical protein n=1 Tax=Escherichia coli TaxID=562 RepID=UPI0019545730